MAIFEMAKNGIWSKNVFVKIDLFDFTSFFGLDSFKLSGPRCTGEKLRIQHQLFKSKFRLKNRIFLNTYFLENRKFCLFYKIGGYK